ncbi:MAG: hypothetical protein Q7U89_06005 [Coriobacteriia bacterium]|nr:hypothetical protein [Coriobacteriia bacterium]
MAHPEMEDHSQEEWLHAARHISDYMVSDQMSAEGRFLVDYDDGSGTPRLLDPDDVRFYRSNVIGSAFWLVND